MRWREVLVEGVLSGQILKDPIVRWLTTILWLWDDWLLHSDYLAHSRTSLFCPDRVIRMIELSGTTQRCHHHGFSMLLVEYDLYNDTDCQEKLQNKVIIKIVTRKKIIASWGNDMPCSASARFLFSWFSFLCYMPHASHIKGAVQLWWWWWCFSAAGSWNNISSTFKCLV